MIYIHHGQQDAFNNGVIKYIINIYSSKLSYDVTGNMASFFNFDWLKNYSNISLHEKKNFFAKKYLSSLISLSKRSHSAVECKFSSDACQALHSVAPQDKKTHTHTYIYIYKTKKGNSLFTFKHFFFSFLL
jgi:hypothetical protein